MSHQDTTEQILDAALAELSEFGLRRATIEDVTRRAKVGRMTLYRRFPSKEELFKAVVMREIARMFARIEAAMQASESVEDGLAEGLIVGLNAVREHALMRRLLASDREAVLPYLTVEAQGAMALVTGFLTPYAAQRVPQAQAARTAETLARIAQSLVLTPFTGTDAELRATAKRMVTALLMPM